MSSKENVEFVKEELNSEEKFLEGFVKIERFYKKIKVIVIGVVAVVVLAIGGITYTNYANTANKKESNIAFNKFLKDNNDKASLETLQNTNKQLFEVAKYLKAKNENKDVEVNITFLKDLAQYTKALKSENIEELSSLSQQNDFLLKEFALFNKALILANNAEYVDARETLKLISKTSRVKDLVVLLNHYLLTK
ncbi:MAG: hypothetical protein HRT43_01615 [Campylobacteraceae bacterium]|nr:hypothetical protein [Campylobacteraceae bacterium]